MYNNAFGPLRGGVLALAGLVLLAACGGPSNPGSSMSGTEAAPAPGAAPSGSTAERDASPDLATDDVVYLSRLGLIRGHLHVGMELFRAGHVMHAQSHMKHPGDELYAALESAFAARGSEGFADELEALATAVENEAAIAAADTAYDALVAAISRAESHVGEGLASDARAQAAIVANLIETAAEEYGVGVDAGRVTDVHEYQDAYGFTLVAGERARAARERVEAGEARNALDAIASEVDSLSGLWPTLVPTEPIGTDPARLEEALGRIEAAAAAL